MPDFATKVKGIVAALKQSNPSVEVWIQLDVNPRIPDTQGQKKSITADEMIREINLISDQVEVIDIFYPRNDLSVVEAVITRLRQ